MRRFPVLAVTFAALTAIAASAHAGERCNEPYAPTIKLSPTATRQDVVNLRNDTQAFLTASDIYQKCLVAKGASDSILHANQVQKEKVGGDFNIAYRAFVASHPGA